MDAKQGIIGTILVIATSLTAIGTFLNAVYTNRQSERISNLRFALESDNVRLDRMTRLYDYTVKALEDCSRSDPRSQKANVALSLIETTLDDQHVAETRLKASLSRAISESECNEGVRERATATQQQAEAREREVRLGSAPSTGTGADIDWANFDIDVFWCTTSGPGARVQAESLRNSLSADPIRRASTKSYSRVRELSPDQAASISRRPREGYLIYSNTDAAERAVASRLKVFAEAQLGSPVEIRDSTQQTPYYVSLFVCPSRTPNAVDGQG